MEILVDVRDVISEFQLTKEDASNLIDYVVKQITARFAQNWEIVAQKNLRTSRQEYIRSLYVGDEGKYTGFVQLRGMFPNMIESGCSPFDMKMGFLHSAKAHPKKDGKGMYFTVPFRWAVPSSIGDSPVFSNVMPIAVYDIAKKNTSTVSSMGGIMRQGTGIKAAQLPPELRIPQTRARIKTESKVFEEYKHKTSMFAGITAEKKTYESATQGSYVSFRRVSDLSDPMSWIHKGIQARLLAEKALSVTNVAHEADVNTDNFLQKLGF